MRKAGEGLERPDAGGTPVDGDFEDSLRRGLHAAVESIEPAQDGLTRILRRLTAPWLVRQASLLVTDWEDLARLITIWLEPAVTLAMSCRATVSGAVYKNRRRLMQQLRPAMAWLRPALPVTGIAIIAVIATVALRQAATRISFEARTGASTSAPAGARSATAGHSQSPPPSITQASPTQITHTHPGNTPSCAPARCPRRPAGTPTPTPSPAITPSGPPTPSSSQSPAPTPRSTHRHHPPHPHPTTPGHKRPSSSNST